MNLRKLDITIPHKLGQAVAFERMLAWLQSQGTKHNPRVTVKSLTVDYGTHSIVLVIVAYEYPVTATISVEADSVHVLSSEATDWAEGAAMWFESLQLKSELGKVLA
jgi:hypothetical protein